MSSSAARLRPLLFFFFKDAKVAEPIVDYVLHVPPNGLGMESISDISSFRSRADRAEYSDGVHCDLLGKLPDFRESRVT
eukprot:3829328-Amphidinium_carterae.1